MFSNILFVTTYFYFHITNFLEMGQKNGFDCFTRGIEPETFENITSREIRYEFVDISNVSNVSSLKKGTDHIEN